MIDTPLTKKLSKQWHNYSPSTILKGKDEKGNRLLLEFAKDFQDIMGKKLCISCTRSFPFQFNKFLNKTGTMFNKTDYELHLRYNGLTLPPYRNDAISNYRMTEEKALYFITHHKQGKKLFNKLPKNVDKKIKAFKEELNDHIVEANKKNINPENLTLSQIKDALSKEEFKKRDTPKKNKSSE